MGKFRLYGTTIDDAVGEAFDKVAKLLGLPYPGGPHLEEAARQGNARRYPLPRPMKGREGADFSFSGLKTAVRLIADAGDVAVNDMAASFQAAVVDILVDRTGAAIRRFKSDFPDAPARPWSLAGGVASNGAIRSALSDLAAREGFQTKIPPPRLCTDNAAMVAWAGVEHGQLGLFDDIGVSPKARWPLAGTPLGGRDGAPAKLGSLALDRSAKAAKVRTPAITRIATENRLETVPPLNADCWDGDVGVEIGHDCLSFYIRDGVDDRLSPPLNFVAGSCRQVGYRGGSQTFNE